MTKGRIVPAFLLTISNGVAADAGAPFCFCSIVTQSKTAADRAAAVYVSCWNGEAACSLHLLGARDADWLGDVRAGGYVAGADGDVQRYIVVGAGLYGSGKAFLG